MKYYITKNTDSLFKKHENDIYHLRYKIFKEVLNWKVETHDNKEIDYFDSLDNVYYILVIDTKTDKLLGSMRLLPTITDYMLEKTFPFLVDHQAPKDEKIWELSRFVVENDIDKTNNYNFNYVTLLLIKGICELAKQHNLLSYVAVTTDRMQRLVKKLRMDACLIGHPEKIENTNVITLQVNMNEQSFSAIDNALLKMNYIEQ